MTTERDLIQRLADMADALDGRKPLVFAQGQAMDGFTALANFQALANEARAYLAQPEPEGPTDAEWQEFLWECLKAQAIAEREGYEFPYCIGTKAEEFRARPAIKPVPQP
jgi:hypothetical protein